MPDSATPAALNYLGRRLDELADAFPTSPAAVDVVTLTDDINLLAHHLEYATERAQERFTVPETVYLPERVAWFGSRRPLPGSRAPWTCSPRP